MKDDIRNPFDNLNYEEKKRTPLDMIAEGYAKNYDFNIEKHSFSDTEVLEKLYNENPDNLNPIQLLTLGMYQLQESRAKQDEEKRRAVKRYMDNEQ